MPEEKKEKKYSITLSEEERELLSHIGLRPELQDLGLSKRKLLTFALRESARTGFFTELKDQLARIENHVIKAPSNIISSEQPRRGRPAKPTEDEKRLEGENFCRLLGGTVTGGGTCNFTKYEVTAIGKAVSYSLGLPFDQLSQEVVDNQYDPSREAWEKAFADQEKHKVDNK